MQLKALQVFQEVEKSFSGIEEIFKLCGTIAIFVMQL